MYDFLKNLAEEKGYIFQYCRTDYANLFDEEVEDGQIVLFADPIRIQKTFDDNNVVIKRTYTGSIFLSMSSDVDEGYQERYDKYIKPINEQAIEDMESKIRCSDFGDVSWNETELNNYTDYNLDGVYVTYSISEDVY